MSVWPIWKIKLKMFLTYDHGGIRAQIIIFNVVP